MHATPSIAAAARRHRGGFTLVEIMIVVSIIVLMLALALPAFRAITGSRSNEGASNQIGAMLAQARADAVGTQLPHGVAFYADSTGQCRMAEVATVPFTPWQGKTVSYPISAYVTFGGQYYISLVAVPFNSMNNDPSVDVARWHHFLDVAGIDRDYTFASTGLFYERMLDQGSQTPSTDTVQLPLGVGVQLVADNSGGLAIGASVTRSSDGYLRAGVVMFDAAGRLSYAPFAFSKYGLLGRAINLHDAVTPTTTYNVAINNTSAPPLPAGLGAPQPLYSSFGVVLYDREAYANQNFPLQDPTFEPSGSYTSATPSESDAESWLDVNATPLLINRYTGSLVRGE